MPDEEFRIAFTDSPMKAAEVAELERSCHEDRGTSLPTSPTRERKQLPHSERAAASRVKSLPSVPLRVDS